METIRKNLVSDVRQRVAEVVVGQDVVVERLLIALFTGGHLLLQGMPGLAKTLLVQTISKTIQKKNYNNLNALGYPFGSFGDKSLSQGHACHP